MRKQFGISGITAAAVVAALLFGAACALTMGQAGCGGSSAPVEPEPITSTDAGPASDADAAPYADLAPAPKAECEEGNDCDDDDPCTTDMCVGGKCASAPVPDCCRKAEDCDEKPANPCTKDFCLAGNICGHEPTDADCDDGNACTTDDACVEGKCVATVTLNCDDGNVCTDDACDPETDCTHTHNTDPCDDGKLCTSGDTCSGGACKAGKAQLNCDDSNACTTDSCDDAMGCEHASIVGCCLTDADCPDDKNPCTVNTCKVGNVCGEPVKMLGCCTSDADCGDKDDLTVDSCKENACHHTVEKVLPGQDPECADNTECADSNPCTEDFCESGKCVHADVKDCCLEDADCDDADDCTTDACDAENHACTNTLVDCDDGNECTKDLCAGECLHFDIFGNCNDGNPCTTEACIKGQCETVAVTVCNDGNPCTDQYCDPAFGQCVPIANSNPCDDGAICTVGDTCGEGACLPGKPLDCNDGNECTVDSCGPEGCAHTLMGGCCSSDADCDDGFDCTKDICDVTHSCVAAPVPDCCEPGEVGKGCCLEDADCDDGDPCTVNACAENVCVKEFVVCDDGNSCTVDFCEAGKGCSTKPLDGASCNDGDACTSGDTCSGGACAGSKISCGDQNPCTDDSCDPATGCVHTSNSVPCSDGNACTMDDTCAGGSCVAGSSVSCDDGNECTTDSCDQVTGCNHIFNFNPSPTCDACDNFDNNLNTVVDEGCNEDGDAYCDAGKLTDGNPDVCPKGGGDCNDKDLNIFPGHGCPLFQPGEQVTTESSWTFDGVKQFSTLRFDWCEAIFYLATQEATCVESWHDDGKTGNPLAPMAADAASIMLNAPVTVTGTPGKCTAVMGVAYHEPALSADPFGGTTNWSPYGSGVKGSATEVHGTFTSKADGMLIFQGVPAEAPLTKAPGARRVKNNAGGGNVVFVIKCG